MKTADNIKKVALVFFILLGLIHILSGLMNANNYMTPASMIINRVLDIPFAMSALIYALSCAYTGLGENRQKLMNTVFIAISIVVLLGLIYINLFIPDKP